MKKSAVIISATIILGALFLGCQEEKSQGIYDPNDSYRENPIISSVSPDSALAGVTEITITGENFSPDPSKNVIYFKSPDKVMEAKVLSSTATEIQLVPPAMYNDSTQIKVSVLGALLYGEFSPYKLKPAVQPIDLAVASDIGAIAAQGVAVDAQNNVYVVQQNYALKKVDPLGNVSKITDLYFSTYGLIGGPNDTLYAAASAGRAKQIVMIGPDGDYSENYATGFTQAPRDLDFDQNGNLWVASGDEIVVVTEDGTKTTVAQMPTELYRLRVFDGSLYVLGHNNDYTEQKIWKAEIQGTSLGNDEVHFDIANNSWLASSDSLVAFEFADDADMYLATSIDTNGVFIVHPDGSHDVLYPGLFNSNLSALSWSNSNYLYGIEVIGSESKLLKINVLKNGAVHWGRTL